MFHVIRLVDLKKKEKKKKHKARADERGSKVELGDVVWKRHQQE